MLSPFTASLRSRRPRQARGIKIDNVALCKFAVLGWCIEWLQAWLLVADDIMDESQTRRGQPCWCAPSGGARGL